MKKILHKMSHYILSTAAISFMCVTAGAQTVGGNSNEIVFTPYLWAASLSGTTAVGSLPPIDVDESFSDILSNLEFALSLHTEFRNGPWVVVIDPLYLSLEADVDPAVPVLGGAPNIDVEMWFIELWAGYRFADNWEVIGGARYQDQDIEISGLPSPPFAVTAASISDSWTDWFAGVRFSSDMGEKWFFIWRGDVVFAGDSDSSINTSVMFNRRFGDRMSLNLGYRHFEDDYDNLPTFAWDMTQSGPIIGYTWVF